MYTLLIKILITWDLEYKAAPQGETQIMQITNPIQLYQFSVKHQY